ncbi:hypothetical protein RFI_38392, partial [Reticulomyxa filosa]
IVVDIFGINCNFVANLYENLGNTYGEWAQHDKAIEYHMKALETRVAIFGAKHVDVALSYNRLGGIYQYKEHNKAIEYYEKSLEITLEIFGFNNDDVAYLSMEDIYCIVWRMAYQDIASKNESKKYLCMNFQRIYSQLSFFCLLANYGNPKVSIELFCFYSLVIFILKYGQIKKFHFTIDWMLKKTSNLSQRISLCLNFVFNVQSICRNLTLLFQNQFKDIQIVYGYFLNGKDMVSYNGSILQRSALEKQSLIASSMFSFFQVFLSKTTKYFKKLQIYIFLINIYELSFFSFFSIILQLKKSGFVFATEQSTLKKKKMSFYLDALHQSTKEKKRKYYG